MSEGEEQKINLNKKPNLRPFIYGIIKEFRKYIESQQKNHISVYKGFIRKAK